MGEILNRLSSQSDTMLFHEGLNHGFEAMDTASLEFTLCGRGVHFLNYLTPTPFGMLPAPRERALAADAFDFAVGSYRHAVFGKPVGTPQAASLRSPLVRWQSRLLRAQPHIAYGGPVNFQDSVTGRIGPVIRPAMQAALDELATGPRSWMPMCEGAQRRLAQGGYFNADWGAEFEGDFATLWQTRVLTPFVGSAGRGIGIAGATADAGAALESGGGLTPRRSSSTAKPRRNSAGYGGRLGDGFPWLQAHIVGVPIAKNHYFRVGADHTDRYLAVGQDDGHGAAGIHHQDLLVFRAEFPRPALYGRVIGLLPPGIRPMGIGVNLQCVKADEVKRHHETCRFRFPFGPKRWIDAPHAMERLASIGPVVVDFAAAATLGVNAPTTRGLVQLADRIDLAAQGAGAAAAAGNEVGQNGAAASGCGYESAVASLAFALIHVTNLRRRRPVVFDKKRRDG
jgi:hypothetical protein